MKTIRLDTTEPSSMPKILLAFVSGVLIAAAGFWLATRHSTPESAQNSQTAAPLPPSATPDRTLPEAAQAGPTEDAPKTGIQLRPTSIRGRRSAFGDDGRRPVVNSTENPSPAVIPTEDNTPIASSRDLPGPEPSDTTPPSPQAETPQRGGEPVFRPEEQAQSAEHNPHTVTIEAGTSLVVRLGETLSTDKNVTGDTFRGVLDSPIVLDGFIIADKGSRVVGRIANSQKAGRVDGLSTLALTLTHINTTDGQTVPIRTSNWERKGERSVASDAAKIGGGAALGAIIGAIAGGGKGAAIGAASGGAVGTGVVLATRGKPTVLAVESQVTFRLDAPVSIIERINH